MLRLVVGLGNPGPEYVSTRHNFGRAVVDALASKLSVKWKTWRQQTLAEFRRQNSGDRIWLFLPDSFMNISGSAVGEFVRFHKLSPEEVLIAHDELDLPLGRVEVRHSGGAAGHHGVESVIEHLGTRDFWRLRIGIWSGGRRSEVGGQIDESTSDYVLGKFTPQEKNHIERVIDAAVEFLIESLENPPKSQSKTIE